MAAAAAATATALEGCLEYRCSQSGQSIVNRSMPVSPDASFRSSLVSLHLQSSLPKQNSDMAEGDERE